MTDQALKDLVASLVASQQKTDEQMKKTNKEMQKTDEQMKKTDEQMKQTDRKFQETQEEIKKLSQYIGNIGNNQGDIAEEFFYNSLHHRKVGGIMYDFIDKNITRKKDDIEDEFDIVLVNGRDIAIIEVKYKAHPRDLQRLLHKKYTNFKKLYPEYKNYKHHLGLASFYMSDDLKEEALSNQVMILQRKGGIIETILPCMGGATQS